MHFEQLMKNEKDSYFQESCEYAGKEVSPDSLNVWSRIGKGQSSLQSIVGDRPCDASRKIRRYWAVSQKNQTGHGSPMNKIWHAPGSNKYADSFQFYHRHGDLFADATEAAVDICKIYRRVSQGLFKDLSKNYQT